MEPKINGDVLHVEIYKLLHKMSNSVGDKITEYHWREFCELMKMLEEEGLITVEFSD